MFLLSNFILRELNVNKPKNVLAIYSIVLGLVIYAAVYLYVLFYHKEKLPLFNTLLIYILSLDLLLSGTLLNQITEQKTTEQSLNLEDNEDTEGLEISEDTDGVEETEGTEGTEGTEETEGADVTEAAEAAENLE